MTSIFWIVGAYVIGALLSLFIQGVLGIQAKEDDKGNNGSFTVGLLTVFWPVGAVIGLVYGIYLWGLRVGKQNKDKGRDLPPNESLRIRFEAGITYRTAPHCTLVIEKKKVVDGNVVVDTATPMHVEWGAGRSERVTCDEVIRTLSNAPQINPAIEGRPS